MASQVPQIHIKLGRKSLAEQHKKDLIQPYTEKGRFNKEFAKEYPNSEFTKDAVKRGEI